METRYCLLIDGEDEKSLIDRKDIVRILDTPIMYNNDNTPFLYNYSILCSKEWDNAVDGRKFIDTPEYDMWFEAVVRLFTDNTFIKNETYKSFDIDSIDDKLDTAGYVTFIWNREIKFIVTNTAKVFKTVYPVPSRYYVVYDESQNVEDNEMLPLLANICNNIGKDNPYNSVMRWTYNDDTKTKNFYIFYSGSRPGQVICQEVVRQYLINTLGLEEAKRQFPKLFITTTRKIYCLYDNEIEPINYELLTKFINAYNILSPEIIHVLDYISPLVVEYGVSDIYPDFRSQKGNNYAVNTFLFYISEVLNHFNGKALSKNFINESEFKEFDDYATVVTGGVEWMVMKKSYNGSYFILNTDNN